MRKQNNIEFEKKKNTSSIKNRKEYIGKIKTNVVGEIPTEIKVQVKNESQKKLIQSIKSSDITICAGAPGTGKTYCAVAVALGLLRKSGTKIKKIYLVKSITSLKGEDMGFLPGDLKDKFDPYMMSFYINMEKVIGEVALKSLIEQEIIRPFPLSYISGVTLDDCIIIGDELQNVSLDNAHRLMTRIGSNSKMILLGDTKQIDLKNKHESSLEKLLDMFSDSEEIGTVRMDSNDANIRHPLISLIEKKFDEYHFNNK
jgi:phosphate starvation-inducible protein PhoH and related proteins